MWGTAAGKETWSETCSDPGEGCRWLRPGGTQSGSGHMWKVEQMRFLAIPCTGYERRK